MPAAATRRVLYIEDEPLNQLLMREPGFDRKRMQWLRTGVVPDEKIVLNWDAAEGEAPNLPCAQP